MYQERAYNTVKKKHPPRLQNTGSVKNDLSNQTIGFLWDGWRRSEIMNHAARRSTPSSAV